MATMGSPASAATINIPTLSSKLSSSIIPAFTFQFQFQFPIKASNRNILRLYSSTSKIKATVDQKGEYSTNSVQNEGGKSSEDIFLEVKDGDLKDVEWSVEVLKNAAKTRKVSAEEILSALSVIEKKKLDPSNFLETLGGTESPGRTWMLIFTAEKRLKSGKYFPITAVQRFDAAGKRIENGVYLGAIGSLTFEGRLSWNKRILAFVFEQIRIKVGSLNPLEINFGGKDKREPSNKDPFFVWFYVDDEIAVARGKSGGTAFWCRCSRVTNL